MKQTASKYGLDPEMRPEDILVSAVMPTRERREYARRAVECFMAQTWQNKELVVLDDADGPSFDSPPAGALYEKLKKRYQIPDKRNMICEMARGHVIAHFDSDDWSKPTRIEEQIRLLLTNNKPVTGYRVMLFWDEIENRAWQYDGNADYALGTSFMFTKAWWRSHKWDRTFEHGSDGPFIREAWNSGALVNPPDVNKMMVARTHKGNTCKRAYGIHWKKVRTSDIPQEFFA